MKNTNFQKANRELSVLLVLFLLIGNSFSQQCNTTLSSVGCPKDGKQLMLALDENFDDPISFEKNWMHSAPNSYVQDGTWISPNNSTISNGTLKLVANDNSGYYPSAPESTSNTFFNYTGGLIESRMTFGIGAFEIRLKLPPINRGFAAFWLWHGDYENKCWQEIDVFEFLRGSVNVNTGLPTINEASSNVKTTFHKALICDVEPHEQGSENYSGVNCADGDWHTIRMEWNGNEIITSVDGTPRNKLYRYYNKYTVLGTDYEGQPLDCNDLGTFNGDARGPCAFPEIGNPMSIIASLVINDHDNPTLGDNYPLTMEVDYIKAWQYADCNEDVHICGNIPQDYPSFKLARNITAGGDCNVVDNLIQNRDYNYSRTEFLATNEIALLSGFESKQTELEGKIVSCQGDAILRSTELNNEQNSTPVENDIVQSVVENKIISISPNPNSGEFSIAITSSSEDHKIMKILDLSGRILYSQSVFLQKGLNSTSIENVNLPAGFYFIKLDGINESKKFIISK